MTGQPIENEDVNDVDIPVEVEDSEEEPTDDPTPPSLEEFQAIQDALKKANSEAKRWRLRAQDKVKDSEKASTDAETPSEDVERVRSEVEAKWRPRVFTASARSALLEAGAVKGERLLKLMDLSELELDDETGEVLGLDEQVSELKDSYPELFASNRKRIPSAGTKGNAPERKLTASEKQAQKLGLSI